MQIKPCHSVLFSLLMLAAAVVVVLWRRGAHGVGSWPWLALAMLLVCCCTLKQALCGKGRCHGGKVDDEGVVATWFGF